MSRFVPGLGSYAFRWSIGHGDRVPPRPMTAMAVLEFGVAHGARVVQFADNMNLHRLDDGALDALLTRAGDAGTALEVGLQGFDQAMVSRYIDIARRLDARILRIALDGADAEADQSVLAGALRGAVGEAKAAGARIAIENHFGYPSPLLVRLLDRVGDDALGVCLDVGNSICAGEWPEETVRLLGPRAINLHLKDYDIVPDRYGVGFRVEGVPFGTGRTDAATVLGGLAERPAMSMIYEHWLPWPGDFETAAAQEREWAAAGLAAFAALT